MNNLQISSFHDTTVQFKLTIFLNKLYLNNTFNHCSDSLSKKILLETNNCDCMKKVLFKSSYKTH